MNGSRVGAGTRERLYASTTVTFDGDLDLIAIEYALNGEPVTLTIPEKIHAARILDSRGIDTKTIGERVRSDPGTIRLWRANGWKPGGKRPKAVTPRTPPACGEPRMYRLHLKAGEACDVCRAAHNAANQRYLATGTSKKPAA